MLLSAEGWHPPFSERNCLQPAGFYNGETGEIEPFSHLDISEHVRYSWFVDHGGGRHPWESKTVPDYKPDGDGYSYAKATRYKDRVVQLGPLSDLVIAGDPLITSFFKAEGPTTWLRQFTRLHRPVSVLHEMHKTVLELDPAPRRTDFRQVGTEDRRGRVRFYQCRAGELGALGEDQRREDRELPNHHADQLERVAARFTGSARTLGRKFYRPGNQGPG